MPNVAHPARWLSALAGLGWDVHLFPVFFDPNVPSPPHPSLADLTYWDPSGIASSQPERDLIVCSPLTSTERAAQDLLGRQPPPAGVLAKLIRRLRPQVVHSLEFQHAGYITYDALETLESEERPVWMVSNYGSDISLFGRLAKHQARIRALLRSADVHVCECERDLALGSEFGFAGW
jgi:hypothetical protein